MIVVLTRRKKREREKNEGGWMVSDRAPVVCVARVMVMVMLSPPEGPPTERGVILTPAEGP